MVGRRPAPGATAEDGTPRDRAVTALVLAVAGIVWFGWGNAAPPAGWLPVLAAGSVLSLAAAAVAVVYLRRLRSVPSAMHDGRTRRRYFITVGIEVAAIVLGVAVLEGSGHPAYLAAWILLVVGVHFVPLARLFRIRSLAVTGIALVPVAAAAAATGLATGVQPSTVAGAGGGLVCLGGAVACLHRVRAAAAGGPHGPARRPGPAA